MKRNASLNIFFLSLSLGFGGLLAFSAIGCKVNKLADMAGSRINVVDGRLEYQMTMTQDSIYIYDNTRLVGVTAWDSKDAIQQIITADNY